MRTFLIPRGATFNPSAGAVAALVEKLAEKGMLPAAAGTATRAVPADERESRTEPVPKKLDAAWLDDPDRIDVVLRWGTLEIHRADDFVCPEAAGIEVIDTECACGEDLAFEWDPDEVVSPFGAASGIFTECEECSRTFNPAKRAAKVHGKDVQGGAAYRFAVVVEGAADPALKALLEETFGRDFHEVAQK